MLHNFVPLCLQEVGQVVIPAGTEHHSGDKAEAPAGLYAPLPGVLVCCCSSTVAPERAAAWARGVLSTLQPHRLLLLGSMQVSCEPVGQSDLRAII